MSPILVRPVREQLEHDRVIRLLQAKYKRKFEVAINPGNEQTAPVGAPESPWYPDLVLQTADKNRKLAGVVEVESAESVNHLEAMSQWKAFSGLRVPFHLYLPTASVDSARRYCSDMEIPVAELWAYQSMGDQIRFTLVHRVGPPEDAKATRSSEPEAEPRPRAATPRPAPARAAAARAAATPAARPSTRPSARSSAPPSTEVPRTNGHPARRPAAAPARRPATTAARPAARPAAKPKVAARRPAAAAPKAVPRKTKSAPTSRAQKRR